nr:CBASS cGAMP-activated phospholipase [Nonlabens ulvanivorans]
MFPTSNYRVVRFFQDKFYQFFRQIFFWGGKYSSKALKSALENEFKKDTIGSLNNLVIVPSFNLVSGITRIFKYPHKEGKFYRDKDIKIVDVALATSAAPTYLPVHEIESELYVDGGVWANNPSLCAVTEAIAHFVGKGKEYSHIELLSVSCLPGASGWPSGVRKNRSFIGWKDKLIQTSMDGQAYFTDYFLRTNLKLISPNSFYHRIESPSLSAEQIKVIQMDRADSKALNTLQTLGDQLGYELSNNKNILRFFQTPKTYDCN